MCNARANEIGVIKPLYEHRKDVFCDCSGLKEDSLYCIEEAYQRGILERCVYGSLAPVFCLASSLITVEKSKIPEALKKQILSDRGRLLQGSRPQLRASRAAGGGLGWEAGKRGPGLTVSGRDFLLDGKKISIYSGAVHYFRSFPESWRGILEKLRAAGFNTVETYVCWNLHEPEKGRFDFSGMLDIERFLALSQELGLYAIVRPGPYICAEWDFGGLPAWLLREQGLRLRCSDPQFLRHVRESLPRACGKAQAASFEQWRQYHCHAGGKRVRQLWQ